MDRRPVLCAECHASNALGAPGLPGVPSLSKAIHDKHDEEVPSSHGRLLQMPSRPADAVPARRDVAASTIWTASIATAAWSRWRENPQPWLKSRAATTRTATARLPAGPGPLPPVQEHGGIYCAACHDSPHAIAPSREAERRHQVLCPAGFATTPCKPAPSATPPRPTPPARTACCPPSKPRSGSTCPPRWPNKSGKRPWRQVRAPAALSHSQSLSRRSSASQPDLSRRCQSREIAVKDETAVPSPSLSFTITSHRRPTVVESPA